ncbi:MAG: prenyltransferase [Actinomycetota bacterium]|nr:prenyltransferase [Actinomycetota bacterium]
MSGRTDLEGLYSALEESSRLLDVPCSRERVLPILTAYRDVIPDASIAFRVATGARHAGELDCRFLSLPKDFDPYAVALGADLTVKTEHPVGSLLADIGQRCAVGRHGVDFGLVGGFKKTWVFFPPDNMQTLAALIAIPSMPSSVAANVDYFNGHGLEDRISVIGIDYQYRTINVYFGAPPAESLAARNVLAMHGDAGLPRPSEQMLMLATKAYGIYFTLSWDSAKIERISFPVRTADPATLSLDLDPRIEKFLHSAPVGAADHVVFYPAMSASGEYYKVHSYYQWRAQMYERYPKRGR